VSLEGCLLFFPFGDADQMVCISEVDLGVNTSLSGGI